jgi:hypothetical protein
MEIEDIKTWQWVLVGLIAGALFSCILAWSGPAFDHQDRDTIEQGEFENRTFALTSVGKIRIIAGPLEQDFMLYHKGMPVLKDVTVHPPLPADKNHYWVTGSFFSITRKPADPKKPNGPSQDFGEWKLFKYPAPFPYRPGYQVFEDKKLESTPLGRRDAAEVAAEKKAFAGQASFPTVVEYLKAVRALPNSNFTFQYAWWELPVYKWTLPPAAGLLIFGVAWPLTLGAMRNYGLAKPVAAKAKPKPVPAKQPVRPSMNKMPAGVVLKETATTPPPVPGERVEYGGEFYPVVKTTHKE